MTRNVRTSTTVLLWVFSIAALGLGVASFMVPPTGQIDPSVLRYVADLVSSLRTGTPRSRSTTWTGNRPSTQLPRNLQGMGRLPRMKMRAKLKNDAP